MAKKKSKSSKKKTSKLKVVDLTPAELERLKKIFESRSKRSKTLDLLKNAKVPVYVETWIRNPGRYDIPGIDTKQLEPKKRKSGVGKVAKKEEAKVEVRPHVGLYNFYAYAVVRKKLPSKIIVNDSVEVRVFFKSMPSEDTRKKLRQLGFKWSSPHWVASKLTLEEAKKILAELKKFLKLEVKYVGISDLRKLEKTVHEMRKIKRKLGLPEKAKVHLLLQKQPDGTYKITVAKPIGYNREIYKKLQEIKKKSHYNVIT